MTTQYLNAINNAISYKQVVKISTSTTSVVPENIGNTLVPNGSSAQGLILDIAGSSSALYASVGLQVATTNNAIVTVTTSSGTIQGQSSVAFGSGDSCVIYCDSVNYYLNNLVLQPANFKAYLSSAMNVPATGTTSTIVFNAINRNIGSFYNSSTGVWTPLLPGIGVCVAQITINFSGIQSTTITAQLQKDGVTICTSEVTGNVGAAESLVLSLSPGLIDFNGSSDNYRVVISQTGTNTQPISTGIDQTFFYCARTALY